MAGFGYRMYRTLGSRVDWLGQPDQPFLESRRHSIIYVCGKGRVFVAQPRAYRGSMQVIPRFVFFFLSRPG